jgi:hypothetical protein
MVDVGTFQERKMTMGKQSRGKKHRSQPDAEFKIAVLDGKTYTDQEYIDKVLWDNAENVARFSRIGDAKGVPYVLTLDEKDQDWRLNGMSVADLAEAAEQWTSPAKNAWIGLQKAMVDDPINIPMLICSETFELATWRLLDRSTRPGG